MPSRSLGGTTLLAVLLGGGTGLAPACGPEVPVYDGDSYRRDPPQVGALAGKIVTSNSGDDTLSVVDPAGPAAAARLPVGFSPVELEGPHHLSVDPQGRFVYVNLSFAVKESGSGPHGAHGAGDLPGYVLKLDARDGREVARLQVEANPGDNAISSDGKTLFVTHYDLIKWAHSLHEPNLRKADSNLVAVDTDRMVVKRRVPLCPAAHGVRLSADGRELYSTCGPDEIAVVNLAHPDWPVRRVPLPGLMEAAVCQRCPYALSVAPDGSVWVSSIGTSVGRGAIDVYVPRAPGEGDFDPARSFPLRGAAMFAAFAPGANGGYRAYVPEQAPSADFIRVYEVASPGAVAREVDALAMRTSECVAPHMLLVAPDGQRGHMVCEGDHRGPGQFVWLDLPAGNVLGSRPIGVFPDGLALVPAAQP